MNCTFEYASPIGKLTIASDGENVTGLWMRDQKYYGQSVEGDLEKRSVPVFKRVREWLDRYFRGEAPDVDFPLAPGGSAFRLIILDILRTIPYGETMTYAEVARQAAAKMDRKSMSSQAVGGAVGHNPISIIIPCHRVVGSNGSLTGFSGGLDKKIHLLRLEKVDMSQFFDPTANADAHSGSLFEPLRPDAAGA